MEKIKATCIGVNGTIEELYFKINDINRFGKSDDGVEAICKVGYDDRYAVILASRGAQEKKELPINMAGSLWLNAHGMPKIIYGNLLVIGMIPKATSFSDCPDEVALQVPLLREEGGGGNFKMVNYSGCSEQLFDEIIETVNDFLNFKNDNYESEK